jgi:hypothetical protein
MPVVRQRAEEGQSGAVGIALGACLLVVSCILLYFVPLNVRAGRHGLFLGGFTHYADVPGQAPPPQSFLAYSGAISVSGTALRLRRTYTGGYWTETSFQLVWW